MRANADFFLIGHVQQPACIKMTLLYTQRVSFFSFSLYFPQMYDTTTAANKAAVLAGSLAGAVALLAYKYNDRPVFAEARTDLPSMQSHPLIGSLIYVNRNKKRFPEFVMEEFEALSTMTL